MQRWHLQRRVRGGTELCSDGFCATTSRPTTRTAARARPRAPTDHLCASGEVCSAGTCGVSCVRGPSLCSGRSVPRRHHRQGQNCGACSTPGTTDHACPSGNVCSRCAPCACGQQRGLIVPRGGQNAQSRLCVSSVPLPRHDRLVRPRRDNVCQRCTRCRSDKRGP